MTTPADTIGPPLWHGAVAFVAAVAVARLLTTGVRRLVHPDAGPASGSLRGVEAAFVLAGLGLYWWEVVAGGQLPVEVTGGVDPALGQRFAAHLVLFGLLAAASWIDLRERVIPDAITVPGVLLGLAVASVWPGSLLPIAREVPRSFALPLREADVLAVCGGLGSPVPSWLAPWPSMTGLALALAVFGLWWWGCTAPAATGAEPVADARRATLDPRWLMLPGGAVGIAAAWLLGGSHWLGLASGLAGLAVAAGVVWCMRLGASWAFGREALGFGDVTLMAMVGSWLGWQPALLACFGGVFIGMAHGLVLAALHRENELPFGPSLCLAAAGIVVAWRPLWERSRTYFDAPGELAAVTVAVVVLTTLSLVAWRRFRGEG